MAEYLVKIDLDKPAYEQAGIHNRWHPQVPAAEIIEQNRSYKIECFDWTGGQVGDNDSADDIKYADLSRIHYLTGPFKVEGCQPGDVLKVHLEDVAPLERQSWGYSGIFAKENGGGFLDKHYPKAAKAVFGFKDGYATSRHIPGVKLPGLCHPGIIGTMPSQEVLDEWNSRESTLVKENPDSDFIVANLPVDKGAFAGINANSEQQALVAKEGARTIPGRPEHGGNCDIKALNKGSTVYLPTYMEGGMLSIGDLHFSQGDGEISFCGAIEMAGEVQFSVSVIKNGMQKLNMKSPMYIAAPVPAPFAPNRYLTFEGFSVDESGKQLCLDTTVAYRQTCIRVIEYLRRYGYNDYQIYLLLSTAPIEGHIASIVDVPNSCTTIGLPMDIFDFDVSPESEVVKRDLGTCAFATDDLKQGFPLTHELPNKFLDLLLQKV